MYALKCPYLYNVLSKFTHHFVQKTVYLLSFGYHFICSILKNTNCFCKAAYAIMFCYQKLNLIWFSSFFMSYMHNFMGNLSHRIFIPDKLRTCVHVY